MLILAGCAGPSGDAAPAPDTDATSSGATAELGLTTRDGVDLVADLYPGAAGAPGVVLLHMIPPAWDRTSWPAAFIGRLQGHGWWVLALDRRGAGESSGAATEAYLGEKGRYDLEAAALHLAAAGAGALVAIGASNGTTTVLDYASWAPLEGLPRVAAAGFMTGGSYTEANTPFSAMPGVPCFFTYSTEERDWSVTQQSLDPGSWSFLEYPNGAHGTAMFEAAPAVTDDIEEFLVNSIDVK